MRKETGRARWTIGEIRCIYVTHDLRQVEDKGLHPSNHKVKVRKVKNKKKVY